jgi:hypothetical protein
MSTSVGQHGNGYGMFIRFENNVGPVSFYQVFATDPEPDKLPHLVATVVVDNTTRNIAFADPTLTKTIITSGVAEVTKSGHVSGRSVARYVLPRLAVFLARLSVA